MDAVSFLPSRERFLPLKTAAILQSLLADPRLACGDRGHLARFAEMIAARFHYEFYHRLERLKALYDPCDPDRETRLLAELNPQEREQQRGEFVTLLRQLLLEANYVELTPEQIQRCVELQSCGGLSVQADLREYADLSVFYRGLSQQVRQRPWFRWPWEPASTTDALFGRTVLLVRPKNNPQGYLWLKVFKAVVAADLEMLLPRVRIRMRWLDRLKIGSSMAGGVCTAAWKIFSAAMLSWWIFLMVLFTFAGAAIKGVFSFLASKTHYLQSLSSNLYFQNLANNSAAIAWLIDAAEAEEVKETLLAYALLYLHRQQPLTQEELDRAAEQWLREKFGLEVDFEVDDAVRKLVEKGLVRVQPAADSPRLVVEDLKEAIHKLDDVWDNFYDGQAAVAAPRNMPPSPHLPSPRAAVQR